jgi:hypothetical protein
MVQTAVLHSTLPAYLKSDLDTQQSKIEIAYAGTDMDDLIHSGGTLDIQALVVDLPLLGDDPEAAVARLEQAVNPELTVIVYSFAKWDLIERRRGEGRYLMRAPLSARALRSSMIGLIVKQLTNGPARVAQPKPSSPAPQGPAPSRIYNDVQLAHLQGIESIVDCECPNQVADLVLALNAFEDYSNQCQNRNAADARMHAFLARVTGHARAQMEYALKQVCAFEKIDVSDLDVPGVVNG